MRSERERGDALLCGITICAVSLLVLVLLWPLPLQAKAFPMVMDLCIGVGGILLALSGLRARASSREAEAPEAFPLQQIAVMLFMGACFLLMPRLGFALTTPLLVFGLLFLAGIRRWLFMVTLTLILEVLVFVGFRLILYISIPAGIFDPTEYLFRLFDM